MVGAVREPRMTKRKTTYKNAGEGNPRLITPKSEKQKELMEALANNNQVIVLGPAGTGKSFVPASFASFLYQTKQIDKIIITRPNVAAGKSIGYFPGPQPLTAPVLTPTGWTTMGDLEVGEFVVGSDGQPKRILEVFDKGEKEVFEVTTSDGRKVQCCDDHLWYTQTKEEHKRGKPGSVKSLKEIKQTFYTKNGKLNHYLPSVSPIEFTSTGTLAIPPYSLGALLGDGSFGNAISLANQETDNEIRDRVSRELKEAFNLDMVKDASSLNYRFTKTYPSNKKSDLEKELTGRWTNPLKQAVYELALLGVNGLDKFIPTDYLFSSVEDRVNLLRGLMDTDGSVKETGESVFHTSSLTLAEDVQHLVRSLGGNSNIRCRGVRKSSTFGERTITASTESYDVSVKLLDFNPFFIKRKANRWSSKYLQRQKFEFVKYVGKKNCRCILIDSKDHLYVTSDFVLTHNTLEEKMMPWVMPVLEVLHWNLTKGVVETGIKNGNIEIAPFETMRGRSFRDAFVICDEAQNLTPHEMKMFNTRIGENVTVVINGDVMQSDLPGTSGLSHAISLVRRYDIPVPIIEFGFEDIVRSDLCKAWITAYYADETKAHATA